MRNDDKRRQRELKRAVKREGNRRRRRSFKRQLELDPEEAPFAEFDFGRSSSASMNGQARDRKRTHGEEE